ncbi:unnamed protein product [Meloidogyne enterolobii]|uniref:Uncharacterized protein n=1 Tax=Meloidogyne enterolobii TaxID=390850 RepID=A0ACB0Y031_MELEN
MDACNTFGPLFKSRLDRVLKQSTNFKAVCFAHHIVKPVLQVGPTCGFASLSNALNIYNLKSPNLNNLVELGRSFGITNGGEIFSVGWFCNFIQKYWPSLHPKIAEFGEMKSSIIEYFGKRENKKIPTILFPYDCDRGNFEPCNRNGLGAHWAILTGCLLLCEDNGGEESTGEYIKIINSSNEFNNVVNGMKWDEKSLYLIGYQGKSRSVFIFWSFNGIYQGRS